MDYYESHGHNARLTCRHFDISPQTFYRWKRRYDPKNLKTLEDRSRRPRHVRQPTASADLIEAVLKTRQVCSKRAYRRRDEEANMGDSLDIL